MDLDVLRATVEENPTNVKAFEQLQDGLLQAGRLPDLKEVYEFVFPAIMDKPERDRILRSVDQRARTEADEGVKHWLNAQLGLLFWKDLGNPDRAEVYFRRVQAAAGQSGMVGEFYTEFYARRENWRRLEQLYNSQGMAPVEVKRRLAEVAEERGKQDKALAFWQQVYNLDPSDDTVYLRLKELYASVAKWHSLVDLLKTRLKAYKNDLDVAIEVHLEMIEVYREHIKSDTKVIAEWQAILKLDPSNLQAMDALQAVYTRMKRWPDLARMLQERIKYTDDPAEQLALHQQIATLMLERFSNSSEAIKHYGAILELDSENLDALRALKGLYEQRKSWEDFVSVSQREIALCTDTAEERSAALVELAGLASQRIRHPRIAMGLWEEIHQNDPDHQEALEQLSGLYERDKQYNKLADVLERLADKAPGDGARIKLLEKLGQVCGARLKDDEKTGRVWKRVLEIDPDHRKAFNEMRKRSLAAQDWESLEWLFRKFGSLPELIRNFEGQLKNLEDREKVPLSDRIADLHLEAGNTPKAVKALENILAIDPEHAGAATKLVPIYRDLERWESLPDVYDVVLDATVPIAERQALLIEKAVVHEQRLGDLDSAFFCYVQAYQEDHQSETIRAEFDRLAEASGNWEVYVSVLEQVVDLFDEAADKVQITLRAADVRHRMLGEHEPALDLYRGVLSDLDPGNSVALDATEAIYRETEQWTELVDVLEDKLATGTLDSEAEKAIRFEIGAVFRDRLEEPGAAMGVYAEMMDSFPDELRVYDELAQLHMQAEDWDELGVVLERKLSVLADTSGVEPGELAELHCKLGMLAYSQGGDIGVAVEHYADALQADSASELAIRSLEELISHPDHQERISLALEPVYAAREADGPLADVLEIQLGFTSTKKGRTALLNRLLDLYDTRLEDAERALFAGSRLFALTPEKKALRTRIEALSEGLNEWQQLADLYEEHVEAVKKGKVRLEIFRVIARAAHVYLEDFERAERIYREILALEPEHAETLENLEDLYLQTDKPEQLLEILRTKETLLAGDDDAVIDNRFQTAGLLADRLERVEDAIEDMRVVLGMRPDHSLALARLDDFYEQTLAWEDLHDILQSRVRLAESDVERTSLLFRLGRLREGQLEAVESAIDTYAEILGIDVVHADAVGALERLFASEEHAIVIAPLLEPTYLARDDWRGLVRVYEVLEAASDDADQKVDYHYRMARLYEEHGARADHAFEHYGAAYRLLPAQEETMSHLLRLAGTLDNHADLTVLLSERVDDVNDEVRRREIHRVIAATLADPCGDKAGAIAHYRSVLDISSEDLPAIDALTELYRARADWEQVVEVLRHKAPLMEVDELKSELLLEAGDIAANKMENPIEAISVYEEVLSIDGSNADALDALAGLYETTEDWYDLVVVLGQKVELADDLDDRKALAREMAGVQEIHLEDLDAAITTHRRIHTWDERDLQELASLDDLLVRTERWHELVPVLDQQVALVEGEAQTGLLIRKADVYQHQLEDSIEAVTVLAEVLGENPIEEQATERLETIVREDEQREFAFETLEAFLEINDEWDRIYSLLDTLVEHREDPAERIAGLHRMGAIAEESMSDPARAFACYGRGLQEDLYHGESMDQVERLAAAHGLWEQLVLLLSDCATAADNPSRALQLRLRAAQVLKTELGDFDRAIATYREVVEDSPDNEDALSSLDDLYQATERWSDLANILMTRIDVSPDADAKVGFYFRLADVYEQHLDDNDQTFEAYQEIFYLQPDNAMAIENLERLARAGVHREEIAAALEPKYVEREQWGKLHALLELRLEDAEDSADRLFLNRRLGDLNLDQMDRKQDALVWYGEAFRLDPEDDGLLSQMETLAADTGAWTTLNEVVLAVPLRLEDSERKIMLWHKGAKVLEEQLGETDQAERIYELVLNEDRENPDVPALQALDRLYLAQERWEDLQGALQWEVAAADFEDEQVVLLLRLGALRRDRLGAPDDAIEAYTEVLERQESQPEALESLANLYRNGGLWADLTEILQRQVDVAESDELRTRLLRERADVAENRLQNPEDAIELWEEILNYAYEDLEAIQHLQRLHRVAEAWESVVENIERELSVLGDTDAERAVALYRELGHLWEGALDDSLNAQTAWEKLLALAPSDVEAMRSLETIHEEATNSEALAEILGTIVASGQFDDDVVLDDYRKLARLFSDALPDPDQAIASWEQVRERAPEDLEAVLALERLFNDEARWEQAVAIMTTKAKMVDVEEAKTTWLNLGEVQQYQLSDWEAAAGSYKKILAAEAGNVEAGERLESIYSEHEQWYDLSELLAERVELLEDPTEKRDLLVRLAELHEGRLDDRGIALIFLQAAQMEASDDLDVLASMERIAGETEQWAELVEPFGLALEALSDSEDKIEVGMRFARLLRDRVDDSAGAVDQFRAVLALDEEHDEALRELDSLLEGAARWAELVEVLEKRFEVAADGFERSDLGLRIGQVKHDRLEDIEGAVEAYRRVLAEGEADARSVDALEKIFTEHERWEDLIEVLDTKAGNGLGDETAIRLEIAGIRERRLEDVEGAIEVYEDILSFDDTQRDALERLLELYAGGDDMEKLTSVYERLLHTADGDAEQIQYCEALALLHQQVHESPETAADYFHRVLSIDETHQEALIALEGIYAELGQYEDLIDIYRRRLDQSGTDRESWARYKQLSAEVYRDKLEDPDNAIFAYRELLAEAPGHLGSLDALEALFTETEQPEQVQEILAKKAEAATDEQERIALMCRRAAIVMEDLEDADGALEILNRALELDPGNDAALGILETVYRGREDWENVIGALGRREAYCANDLERAGVQVRIADVYRDHVDQGGQRAVEHYERAMRLVPDSVETAERLAELYVIAADWVKAEPLLSMIVGRLADDDGSDAERRANLHYNLGLAYQNLLRREEALAQYERALALHPGDVDVLQALGKLAYETGEYAKAEEIYSQLVVELEADADDDTLVDLYRTLGQVAFKGGQSAKAMEYLQKTVELQPGSPDALVALIELCEEQEYWQGVVDYAAELRDLKSDLLEKFELQLRIGDTWLRRLMDVDEAVSAYSAALDFQPGSKAAHFKIFQVLLDAEHYEEAVDILNRLVELEQDAKTRAKYLGAIGDIFRERLEDGPRAVEFYSRALDEDPSLLKLFRFVDEILTRGKDWKALQRAYRAMLKRVQGDDSKLSLQYQLAFNLGEIYRSRVKQLEKAQAAFELARELKPKDGKTLQILSELYEANEDFEAAIEVERTLLKLKPGDLAHYRTLKRLFFDAGDEDAAWVACGVLVLLGKANDREREFYDNHAVPDMAEPAGSDVDIWASALLADGEDRLIGEVLYVIYQGIGPSLNVKSIKDFGLKKKSRLDLSQREIFSHSLTECARALGISPPPQVYHSATQSGLVVGDMVPPIMVVGDDLRQGKTEQELAFWLSKALTYFHPLHIAVMAVSAQTLDVLFKAAIKMFVPDYDTRGLDRDEGFLSIIEALSEMPAQLRESLRGHVAAFIQRKEQPNLTRWLNQIQLSANHAALLMTGDPVVTGNFIKAETSRPLFSPPGRTSTRDKLVDLATYSLGAEYLGLRRALHVCID